MGDTPDLYAETTFDGDDLAAAMRARMGLEADESTEDELPDESTEDDSAADDADEQDDSGESDDSDDSESLGLSRGEGDDGGGGGSGAAPPPEDPQFIRINGRLYPIEQEEQLGQLIDWATEQIMSAPRAGQAPAAPPAPADPPADPPAPFDPNEYVDPDLARRMDERFNALDPLTRQVDRLTQMEERRAMEESRRLQEEINTAAEEALDAIQEQYNLSADERARLETLTVESGRVPLYQQQSDDMDVVFNRALEDTIWSTPEFRQKLIDAQTAIAVEEAKAAAAEQQQATARTERKRKAGALAGGSSAVRRADPPPATAKDRRAAMRDAFAKVMNE